MVVRLLEFLDHEVVQASCGLDALKALRDVRDIELVILDERMPGLQGSEVLAQMRSFLPKTPVLLSSGNSGLETSDPHATVLVKPYRLDSLEEAIAQLTASP